MQKRLSKDGSSTESRRTEFEKYETMVISRSQIKNAPYNPRTISDKAKKMLRDNIRRVGLVAPPTWNKRTGNIVSGHQRLACLDALEGKSEYLLTVAAVDLDDKQEREQNIFMNNQLAMGDWDIEKLNTMFKNDGIEAACSGFDAADIYQLFGEKTEDMPVKELSELGDKLRDLENMVNTIKKKNKDRDDCDFYMVVVFDSYDSRKKFTDELGFDDNRYQAGDRILDHIRSLKA